MSADGPVGQASGFPTVSFLEVDGKVLSGEEFEEYAKIMACVVVVPGLRRTNVR